MDYQDRWFDDFTVGEVIEVGPHLMTEDRMLSFAVEFDPQPFHTDPDAAEQSIYGGLIASGWHTGSVLMRLLTTILGPASMGSPGCREMRWVAPVRAGDELTLRVTVEESRLSSSRPGVGVLEVRNEVFDQNQRLVMSLLSTMLIACREAELEPGSQPDPVARNEPGNQVWLGYWAR